MSVIKYEDGIFWDLAKDAENLLEKVNEEEKQSEVEEMFEKLEGDELMKARQQLLYKYISKFSKDHYTKTHVAVLTCEAADKETVPLFKDKPHIFAKNLFLKGKKKKNFYLVLADENTRVKLSDLAKKLKSGGFRFASKDDLVKTMLVEGGAVTGLAMYPSGLRSEDMVVDKKIVLTKEEIVAIKKVTVIVDSTLLETDKRLIFHPLVNTASTSIAAGDFIKFIDSLQAQPSIFFDFTKNEVFERKGDQITRMKGFLDKFVHKNKTESTAPIQCSETVVGSYLHQGKMLLVVCSTYVECFSYPELKSLWSTSVSWSLESQHICSLLLGDYNEIVTGDLDGFIRIFSLKRKGRLVRSLPDGAKLKLKMEYIKRNKNSKAKSSNKGSSREKPGEKKKGVLPFMTNIDIKQKYKNKENPPLLQIDFSPVNNKIIASYMDSHVIKLWNLERGTVDFEFGMKLKNLKSVSVFHAIGNRLTVGYSDGKFTQFCTKTGTHLKWIGDIRKEKPIRNIVYLPRARYVILSKPDIASGGFIFWDLIHERSIAEHENHLSVSLYDEVRDVLFCMNNQNMKLKLFKIVLSDVKGTTSLSVIPNRQITKKKPDVRIKRKLVCLREFELGFEIKKMMYHPNEDLLVVCTKKNQIMFIENILTVSSKYFTQKYSLKFPVFRRDQLEMVKYLDTSEEELVKEMVRSPNRSESYTFSETNSKKNILNLILTGLVDEGEKEKKMFEKFRTESEKIMHTLLKKKEALVSHQNKMKATLYDKYEQYLTHTNFVNNLKLMEATYISDLERLRDKFLKSIERVEEMYDSKTAEMKEKKDSRKDKCLKKFEFLKSTYNYKFHLLDLKHKNDIESLINEKMLATSGGKSDGKNVSETQKERMKVFSKYQVFLKKSNLVYFGINKNFVVVLKFLPPQLVPPRFPKSNYLVEIMDVIYLKNQTVLVMEKMKETLYRVVEKSNNNSLGENLLPKERILRLIYELLNAVRVLNDLGYVHGEINLKTVFIDYLGKLKISHFGFVRKRTSIRDQYQNGFCFSSPERILGSITKNSDIFSIGMLFHYLWNHKNFPSKMKLTPILTKHKVLQFLYKFSSQTLDQTKWNNFFSRYNTVMTSTVNLNFKKEKKVVYSEVFVVKQLISKMLMFDPGKRISAEDSIRFFENLIFKQK